MSDDLKKWGLLSLAICFAFAVMAELPTLPQVIVGGIFAIMGIPAAVTGV